MLYTRHACKIESFRSVWIVFAASTIVQDFCVCVHLSSFIVISSYYFLLFSNLHCLLLIDFIFLMSSMFFDVFDLLRNHSNLINSKTLNCFDICLLIESSIDRILLYNSTIIINLISLIILSTVKYFPQSLPFKRKILN